MSRVAVTSSVYLGDVAPFIPVARRLSERGHDVVFVAPEGFRTLVAREPFTFHPYGLDCSPATMNADPEHSRLMRHPRRNVGKLGAYWTRRTFADDPRAAVDSMRDGFAGADAVVTHPTLGSVSVPVAHSMGIPTVVGHLFPMMIPTDSWTPPLGSRSPNLSRRVNRAVWAFLRVVAGRMGDAAINDTRRELGAPPLRGNTGWGWLESDETVLLYSRHLYGEGAADWPPVSWGGFSVWDGPPAQELDDDLDRYIDDGDAPVLVTLGTSAATDAGRQFATIASGLDAVGLRSVLLVGHAGNLAPLEGRRGAVAFAPMTKVLPRCRAAVVSGALGGVAAALTAGVPVVVHPQLFDQVWHGRRVEELGVGLLAARTSRVAAAVARVTDDPSFTERARALAAQLADEDGPGRAADAVEALISSRESS